MSDTKISVGGGFFSTLTIVFITLKLLDKIDWNWFWVLSPILIPLAILIIIIIFVLLGFAIFGE